MHLNGILNHKFVFSFTINTSSGRHGLVSGGEDNWEEHNERLYIQICFNYIYAKKIEIGIKFVYAIFRFSILHSY